jgi:poly(3-hydroxybutyrate) depolymerase
MVPDADGASPSDAKSEPSEASTTYQSPGCTSGAGLAEGEHSFDLEGRSRRYILRLPKGYPGSHPWPLVLALHPNGSSAPYWDKTDGGALDIRTVLANDAVLVLAEAIEGNWRDYSQPETSWPPRLESELLYFDAVLAQVQKELCIDTRSIFSMGFSGGGSFSGVLACRRNDIRAIAVAGSVIYFDEADCIGKSAAWISIGAQEMSSGRQAFRDFFRDRAGCAATSTDTPPAPCVAYDGCDPDAPVHYCEHPDGHIWPDFGSQAMWGFFSQFVAK